jgi:hypothetical protein
MRRQTRYEVGLHLRIGVEDYRRLEAIAERERSNVSVVARRFIAEGLDREAGAKARGPRGQGEKL